MRADTGAHQNVAFCPELRAPPQTRSRIHRLPMLHSYPRLPGAPYCIPSEGSEEDSEREMSSGGRRGGGGDDTSAAHHNDA